MSSGQHAPSLRGRHPASSSGPDMRGGEDGLHYMGKAPGSKVHSKRKKKRVKMEYGGMVPPPLSAMPTGVMTGPGSGLPQGSTGWPGTPTSSIQNMGGLRV